MRLNKITYFCILFLWVMSVALAREGTITCILDDHEFKLPFVLMDDKKFIDSDDLQVRQMIYRNGKTFSWSNSGNILMVFSSGEQLTVTDGSELIERNGKESVRAEGSIKSLDNKFYIQQELFFQLLDLVAKDVVDGDKIELLHRLPEPQFVLSDFGPRIIIDLKGKVNWQEVSRKDDSFKLVFKNSLWDGESSKHLEGHINLTVESGKDDEVTFTFNFPFKCHPKLQNALQREDVIITCTLDRYRQKNNEESGNLLEVLSQDDGWQLEADKHFAYYWHFCPDCQLLTLDIPHLNQKLNLDDPRVNISNYSYSAQNITRLEFRMDNFIISADEREPLLSVKIVSDGELQELSSRGHTAGYVVNGKCIVIDPGHGGGDRGCRSRHWGTCEKEITLDVALRLAEILKNDGWEVVLTRETDRDVSWLGSPDKVELQSRCDVANDIEADYFVSLHCNANVSSRPNGSVIYWYKEDDLELANCLEDVLEEMDFYQWGLMREGFYILRHTDMPAVLVEMAFLTNYEDGKVLSSSDGRQKIAEIIAESLRELRDK
ncbi:N-acetylmuramoyl-L-alanine amidase [bacterium]|nr:N-acetylmuramoyl-L-alanine amidase [bacterium]